MITGLFSRGQPVTLMLALRLSLAQVSFPGPHLRAQSLNQPIIE